MKKFKLIHAQTKEEHICSKVSIDGDDYYVSESENISVNDFVTDGYKTWRWEDNSSLLGRKLVIASNNPEFVIGKIVDESEKAAHIKYNSIADGTKFQEEAKLFWIGGFQYGCENLKQSHPFSEQDMIDFSWWLVKNIGKFSDDIQAHYNREYFKIWKENHKLTILYYE